MDDHSFNVKEELSKLPKKPGVYIMHGSKDEIIYVGKAVNLYNRVRSYFRENIGRGPKIDKMVTLIERFEYIVTDSELEALVLENNLIKEHRPKYNTMLMDDKTYPYIKVTVNEAYPRVFITRKMIRDKAKYYGPFASLDKVHLAVDCINKTYGIRKCQRSFSGPDDDGRECLNYHIGQCSGPCKGNISKYEYAQRIKEVLDIMAGNNSSIIKALKDKMNTASEELNFEEAASLRDSIEAIKYISQKQKIEDSNLDDKDIVGMAVEGNEAVAQIFFVRNGKMVGREHYYLKNATDLLEVTDSFIKQFYGGTPTLPREIMIPCEISEKETIEKWLSSKRGNRVYITTPKIGQKEKLLELACKNAAIILKQDKENIKREEARTIGAVKEIEKWLGLTNIKRMEAFDISNISGFENVASMVVFEKGKPKKSDYRKFKIKTVAGPDDYACMKEALTRRFTYDKRHENHKEAGFSRLPDLLLMDGGRGQVNIALEVIKELGINVPVCGMVKDNNHRTRGVYYNNVEIPIDTRSEGFKLVTRVQDEAHRFAIEYHRSLRTKEQVHSVLDDIPGIGEKRRIAIMKVYSDIEEIKKASSREIVEKVGLPRDVAEKICEYFKK